MSMEGVWRARGSNPLTSKLRLLALDSERLRLAGQTSLLHRRTLGRSLPDDLSATAICPSGFRPIDALATAEASRSLRRRGEVGLHMQPRRLRLREATSGKPNSAEARDTALSKKGRSLSDDLSAIAICPSGFRPIDALATAEASWSFKRQGVVGLLCVTRYPRLRSKSL
jgi:hypothetical protein